MPGMWQFLTGDLFLPAAQWTTINIPNLVGKVVVLTGANAGIGRETVRALLQHGAKVYIACRTKARADEAITDLQNDIADGAEVHFVELDLSRLESVRTCAKEILRKEHRIDVLINNAGVSAKKDKLTADGFDLTFGTNVIGHWLFTELLLSALVSAPDSTAKPRIVTLSSCAAYISKLDFDTFTDTPARLKKGDIGLYAQSKYGNAVIAHEFSRRYGDRLVSIAVHPGTVDSELTRGALSFAKPILGKVFQNTTTGAINPLYAATSPEAAELNGQFLIPWRRIGEQPNGVFDLELGRKLWSWLEEATGHRSSE